MSHSAHIGRHRAPARPTALSTIARAVSSNAGSMGRQAAVVAAASGMVLATGVSATAAQPPVDREASAASALQIQTAPAAKVTVPSAATVSFDRPDVSSSAAPVEEAPELVVTPQANEVEADVPAPAPAVVPAQPAVQPTVQAQTSTTTNTTTTTNTSTNINTATGTQSEAPTGGQQGSSAGQAPSSSSGIAARIASAAYAQLGVGQDCTMLVTNALAAVGINHHGWPDSYFSLGTQVSAAQAQPGDLVYYADGGTGMAHIAVYVGGGQAIHGGWKGGTTAKATVNVGSGPVYIHVNG